MLIHASRYQITNKIVSKNDLINWIFDYLYNKVNFYMAYCISGLTDGVYSYTDCCGILQTGASLGESICVDSLPIILSPCIP